VKIQNSPWPVEPGSRLAGSLKTRSGESGEGSFARQLLDALEEVNRLQLEADRSIARLVAGEEVDLHQVDIAGEKAQLALQLTMQLRNKVLEAYQEIMRMPL